MDDNSVKSLLINRRLAIFLTIYRSFTLTQLNKSQYNIFATDENNFDHIPS